jgi:CheY-like chemotaxis protein
MALDTRRVLTAKDLTPEDQECLRGAVQDIMQKGSYSRDDLLREVRDLMRPGHGCGNCGEALSRNLNRRFVGVRHYAKLLLVEDNELNRDMLSRRLQRKGYEMVIATDGQQGVQVAQEQHPDLILMDMSLPVIDGWEATRLLKADASTQSIPVVALTAHAMAGDREKAMEAGCDDYDTKPIELPRLLEKIEALLNKS